MKNKTISKEKLLFDCIKAIKDIIKNVENEINEIYEESTLEKPIMSNIVLSKRNMAYNEIKAEIKKFAKNIKKDK